MLTSIALAGMPGLCLRPFEDRDAPGFTAAALESVATVAPWLPWSHACYDEAEALAWFASCRAHAATGTAHELGIFTQNREAPQDGSPGLCVGSAGLNLIEPDRSNCNLGYWVRQSWQGRGVASACVQALQRLAFNALGLQRVEIIAAVGNTASYRVAHKAGAINEGVRTGRLVSRQSSDVADGTPPSSRSARRRPQPRLDVWARTATRRCDSRASTDRHWMVDATLAIRGEPREAWVFSLPRPALS